MDRLVRGSTQQFSFIVTDASGAPVDVDVGTTPTVTIYYAGSLVAEEDASRFAGSTMVGHYNAQIVLEVADFFFNRIYSAVARATVDGIETKAIIKTFDLDPGRTEGACSDGAPNTETNFGTYLVETDDNYWKDALILMTSGALAGQVKKVTAYDGTTKKITVAGGFTDPPIEDDRFELLTR